MKGIIMFFTFLLVFSCDDKKDQKTLESDTQKKDEQRIAAEDISRLKYTDYVTQSKCKGSGYGLAEVSGINDADRLSKKSGFFIFQ